MTSITIAKLGLFAFLGVSVPCAPSGTTRDDLEQIGSLHTARSAHTATTLKSGLVLIVGGMTSGEGLASVELFDPSRKALEVLGSRRLQWRLCAIGGDLRSGNTKVSTSRFVDRGAKRTYCHSVAQRPSAVHGRSRQRLDISRRFSLRRPEDSCSRER
jgi:hypothetical protein